MTTTNASQPAPPPETGAVEHLNIVIVGHVDHGKSTLLGRLYADTGSLPDGKLEKVQAICRQQGKEFEYAFLFDAFLEEQEQGITIDTARTFFKWKGREYIIIDAPGHKEFLKNMVSGAARAEGALLVIDAAEGVQEQSKKHGYLLSLLGVRQVAVVVNKMDLVGYRQDVFDAIEAEYREYLSRHNVTPQRFIPVSAKLGDNVADASTTMPWYTGLTVLDTLGMFTKERPPQAAPLRLPVQDVYKFDARRIIAGRIESGTLRVGDQLVFSPSNKSAVVRTIEQFNVEPPAQEAHAGQSIGVTLDEQIFIERGEVATLAGSAPGVSTQFQANVFWLGERPLTMGRTYVVRLATAETLCQVTAIHRIVDTADLDEQRTEGGVGKNQVAEVTLHAKSPLGLDLYADFQRTGRFVIVDGYDVAGGGIVTGVLADEHQSLRDAARTRDLLWEGGDVTSEARAQAIGHRAGFVLVTGGAPGAAEDAARRLESRLIQDGCHAYLVEVDNLRHGLASDVAAGDAAELVRRLGEAGRLLTDAGVLVVAAVEGADADAIETIETLVRPAPFIHTPLAADSKAGGAGLEATVKELVTRGVFFDDGRGRYPFPKYVI